MLSRLDPRGRTSARDGLNIFVSCFALAAVTIHSGAGRLPVALILVVVAALAVVMVLNGWRRAHDLGFPGAFGLIPLLFPGLVLLGVWNPKLWIWLGTAWPLVGASIWAGWEASRDGEPRPNPYGPDPLGRAPKGLSDEGKAVRALLRRKSRPTWRLIEAESPGFSKLGGAPDLAEDGTPWPHWTTTPHEFIAQLDFAELRAASGPDWLPDTGCLYLFFNVEQGLDHSLAVGEGFELIHRAGAPVDGPLLRPPSPRIVYPERRVGFLAAKSYPDLDRLGEAAEGLEDADLDALADFGQPGEGRDHRIGGYASPIQSDDMELTCELASRRLDPEWWRSSDTPPRSPRMESGPVVAAIAADRFRRGSRHELGRRRHAVFLDPRTGRPGW